MFPDVIDNTNFRYITLNNNTFCISLCSKSLPSNIFFLDIVKDIDKNMQIDISFFIFKLDPQKALNSISYSLSSNLSELSSIKTTQRNIDVISKTSEDSAKLRKKIQTENEEIYNLNILFTIYSDNLNSLFLAVSKFKARMYSRGIVLNLLNFNHLEGYLSNLPFGYNSFSNTQYITTSALANIFPFYTMNIIDENGVEIGYTLPDKRLCFVDIFSPKYNNSNMCIFGSSGSGKSFYTKLLILRQFFRGRRQIVLDIENEYSSLCENLDGYNIFNTSYFNPFRVTKREIQKYESNIGKEIDKKAKFSCFLDEKIARIISFLEYVVGLDEEEKAILEYYIFELYLDFGITRELDSLYVKDEEKINIFSQDVISSFPTFLDLEVKLNKEDIKIDLKGKIGRMSRYFCEDMEVNFNSNLFVLNLSEIKNEERLIEYVLDYILSQLENKNLNLIQTVIYIDEVWKYAKSKKMLDTISNMYKTIRKRNGSIVTITQDITDFFSLDEGRYALGILNNSAFKTIFKIEYADKELLSKLVSDDVYFLQKGEAFLVVNNSCLRLKIVANEFEKEIINENNTWNK